MIIIGIDPGSRKTGYGIIKFENSRIEYIDSGVFIYDDKIDFLQRVKEIHDSFTNLFKAYSPDEIAFESLIYVKNPTSLSKLAQTRGVILAACSSSVSKKTFEYSPNLVKSTVSGHGHADKSSMQKMIGLILGKKDFKTDDESDALAIAICHAMRGNSLSTQKSKTSRKRSSLSKALEHRIRE